MKPSKALSMISLATKAGKTASEYVQRRAALAVSIAGKDLTPESRRVLYDALDSICENLKNISENGLSDDV